MMLSSAATTSRESSQELSRAHRAERGARPEIVLEARGLRKIYGQGAATITVLDGVDFAIERGEMVAIVAPSGAGKSTLLHLLAALDMPTSGTVYFGSKAIETLREQELADYRNRSIGFVWQRHHLLADFTAAENVAMPLLMRGRATRESLAEARRWLAEVGLAERADHLAGQLSGGEQQRAAIARALVHEPAVLLADEPTGNLDERNASGVFEQMRQLCRAHRLTSVLATHNWGLARQADRMLQLENGVLRPVSETSNGPGNAV
jgi:lipoprotein-releasing system ATP-binding protein